MQKRSFAPLTDSIVDGTIRNRIVLFKPPGSRTLGLANIEELTIGRGTGHLWSQTYFAWKARHGVALSLAASGPVLHSRHFVVIHDAAVYRHPSFYSRSYGTLHRVMGRALARTASIGTVSDFSRLELAAVLNIDPSAIVVAKNGADHINLRPDLGIVDRLELARRPFFLFVGNLARHKNLTVAMAAVAELEDPRTVLLAVGAMQNAVFGSGD